MIKEYFRNKKDKTLKVFKGSQEGKRLVKCKDADDMFNRLGV